MADKTKKEDYHIYSHTTSFQEKEGEDATTMGDFVAEPNSLGIGLNIPEILNYIDEDGHTNLDHLLIKYSEVELADPKIQSIIQLVKDYKPTQEKNNSQAIVGNKTGDVSNIAITDQSKKDVSTIVKPLLEKFKRQLDSFKASSKFKAMQTYRFRQARLNELYSQDVVLLFKQFIFRVETETAYFVRFTDVRRTVDQQQIHVDKKESKSLFSLHLLSIAVDINLIRKRIDNMQSKTDLSGIVDRPGEFSRAENLAVILGINRFIIPHKDQLYGASVEEIWASLNCTKYSPKLAWINSKAVGIAKELDLRWGGDFEVSDNFKFDPVHFDAKNYFLSINGSNYLKAIGVSPPSQPNTTIQDEFVDVNGPFLDLPLHIGTVFSLPLSKLDRDVLSTETNQVTDSVDFEGFLARQLVDLLSDKQYKRTFTPKSQSFHGTVQEIFPHISVWVWSRALSLSGLGVGDGPMEYEHQIINITPYITSLNTNVVDNGGNFSVSLSAITSDISNRPNGGNAFLSQSWKIKEGSQKSSNKKKNLDKEEGAGDYVSQNYTHYIEKGELKRSRMYFDKVLQANDLVFIKFERLELENERSNLDQLETIDISQLPNQIFDMIGLIDNVQLDNQPVTANSSVSVTGRDLTKLLIEDGVYFYPSEFTSSGIFSNTGATNIRLGRFGKNGEYLERFQGLNKSVERSLKFIINNLGSIEICPSNLFDSYENAQSSITNKFLGTTDKRSKAYQLTDSTKEQAKKESNKIEDQKKKILSKINQVAIKKNVDLIIFNKIESFLKGRIAEKKIEVENGKIKSWTTIDIDNKEIKNRLPIDLDREFFLADRVWLKESQGKKNGVIQATISTVNLTNLYDKAHALDKGKLLSNATDLDLVLIKELDRSIGKSSSVYYSEDISEIFKQISEHANKKDDYRAYYSISPLFIREEILIANDTYETEKIKSGVVRLGIVAITYLELFQEKQDIFNDIYNFIITVDSQQKDTQSQELLPLAGIWQIVKLVIDDSVKDRRLIDSSIGNENGSILNAIRKICQDPFCEFYTDTYGDQFYFIVRKKPFDRESIVSMIDGRVRFDALTPIDTSKISENEAQFQDFTNVPTQPTIQNLILDIEEKDVLSDTLQYCTEAYSWYRLTLPNMTSGNASDMAWAYLKGIYFNEFADIFGSKPLDVQNSYIPFKPVVDRNQEKNNAYFIEQGIKDLKYLIESHAYLPFTRTGTIILNGDRRYKKGTFVRLKGTGEIFYVDGVSHSFSITEDSIQRTTTLQVSRGMVERFIKGVPYKITTPILHDSVASDDFITKTKREEEINISYFNICDLFIDPNIFTNRDMGYSDFSKASTAQWKVNKEVFAFFLKKLQFSKNDKEVFG